MRALAAAALALLVAFPAAAQGWRDYGGKGFAILFPAPPTQASTTYSPRPDLSVPATLYSAHRDNIDFTVLVADFSKTPIEQQDAVDDAVRALSRDGTIVQNLMQRFDEQFGRVLTVTGHDGSRATVALFFFKRRFYEIEGRAAPPNAQGGSGPIGRFVQSLQFPNEGGDGKRPLRTIPLQAIAACRGKAAGDAVQRMTPTGPVPALCAQTPRGLVAQPSGQASPDAEPETAGDD